MRDREDTRLLMAMTAMEGMLSRDLEGFSGTPDMTAHDLVAWEAVRYADALLWVLEETGRVCQWRYVPERGSWFTGCEDEIGLGRDLSRTNITYCPICGHRIEPVDEEAA